MESERMLILQMVAEKKITVSEGVQLLKALEGAKSEKTGQQHGTPVPIAPVSPTMPAEPREPGFGRPAAGPRSANFGEAVSGDFASKIGSLVESLIANFGFGFGEGYRFEENIEGEFGDGETALLDINTKNGRIMIQAWDKPGYAVKLVKQIRGGSEQEARAKADRLAEVSKEPNRLAIRMNEIGLMNAGMAIIAYLPKSKKYAASLQTANGRIEAIGLTCTTIDSRTANGVVKFDGIDADTVHLTSSNGKILLRTTATDVKAHSSNGRIVLIPLQVGEHKDSRYELSTSNGSVRVKASAEPDTGFSFDLSTSLGKIDLPEGINLNYELNDRSHVRRALRAKTHGFESKPRKIEIIARTSNGKIALDESVSWE